MKKAAIRDCIDEIVRHGAVSAAEAKSLDEIRLFHSIPPRPPFRYDSTREVGDSVI